MVKDTKIAMVKDLMKKLKNKTKAKYNSMIFV